MVGVCWWNEEPRESSVRCSHVVDDEVVDHAVEAEEEEDHEVDELAERDVLREGQARKDLRGVDAVALGVDCVGVPRRERDAEGKLDPEAAEEEERRDGKERNHLRHHQRVQTLRKVYRIQVDVKVAVRHELWVASHTRNMKRKRKRKGRNSEKLCE